jgi:2-polyprenyl-3-methyl-5-hydroxy-6-metoxy-1,4-benzoquinol methylase
MGAATKVTLEKHNIYESSNDRRQYDSIVVSEVLEHLEDPEGALQGMHQLLKPGGRAFLNIPCNSPAPDHLYLFTTPDHFFGMLEANGYVVVERFVTPSTGWTLERALRQQLAVSCAAIVQRVNDR